MALYAAKLVVRGRVQDVSFRSFTKKNADMLGLSGFAKNVDDDKVEVFAEGDKDAIETLIEALRSGSERAIVKNVDIEWHTYSGTYPGFKIIY